MVEGTRREKVLVRLDALQKEKVFTKAQSPQGIIKSPHDKKAKETNISAARQALERAREQHQQTSPKAPENTAPHKVERVVNELCESKPATIGFAGALDSDANTEMIALNLIDYIIIPHNWNPELACNVLAATCFFFASQITGKSNTAEQVASSHVNDPNAFASMAGVFERYDLTIRERLVRALSVRAEDVKMGYAIIYRIRDRFRDLFGDYAVVIHTLPHPSELDKPPDPGAIDGSGVREGQDQDQVLASGDDAVEQQEDVKKQGDEAVKQKDDAVKQEDFNLDLEFDKPAGLPEADLIYFYLEEDGSTSIATGTTEPAVHKAEDTKKQQSVKLNEFEQFVHDNE